MITLEEAIAHEKQKADKARESEALFLHDDLMWNAKESHRRLEEHEQYAAFLEELGRRRVEELFRKTDEKSIRDKAIEDVLEILKRYNVPFNCDANYEILQLKECGSND